MKFTFGFKCVR